MQPISKEFSLLLETNSSIQYLYEKLSLSYGFQF